MCGLITLGECAIILIPAFREMGFNEKTLDPHPFIDILLNGALLFFLHQKGWKKLLAFMPFGIIAFSFSVTLVESLGGGYQSYFPYFLRSGYNLIGPAFSLGFTLGMYLFSKFKEKMNLELSETKTQFFSNLSACAVSLLLYGILAIICCVMMPHGSQGAPLYSWQSYCLISLIIILFYNGLRGYDRPWWRIFSYWYFLIHMAVIALLAIFVF